MHHNNSVQAKESYKPLIIILLIITISSLLLVSKDFKIPLNMILGNFMNYFMIGYLLTFATVKLLDIQGFVEGYRMYDLLAKRSKFYAYFYPFLELILGFLYILISPNNLYLNIFTMLLFAFSSIGIIQEITKKSGIHCSCLGSILNVPLSWVSLVENLFMIAMAGMMLIL